MLEPAVLAGLLAGLAVAYLAVVAKLSQVALKTYRDWKAGENAVFDQLAATHDIEEAAVRSKAGRRGVVQAPPPPPPPQSLPYTTEKDSSANAAVTAAGTAALASAAGVRPPTGQSRRRDAIESNRATPVSDAKADGGISPLTWAVAPTSAFAGTGSVPSDDLRAEPVGATPSRPTSPAAGEQSASASGAPQAELPAEGYSPPPTIGEGGVAKVQGAHLGRPGTGFELCVRTSGLPTPDEARRSTSEPASRPVTRQGIADLLGVPSTDEFARALRQARTSANAGVEQDATTSLGASIHWSRSPGEDGDGPRAVSPIVLTSGGHASPPPAFVAPDAYPTPLHLMPSKQSDALFDAGIARFDARDVEPPADAAGAGAGALEALGASAFASAGGPASDVQSSTYIIAGATAAPPDIGGQLFIPRHPAELDDAPTLEMEEDTTSAPVFVPEAPIGELTPVGGSPARKLPPLPKPGSRSPMRVAEV